MGETHCGPCMGRQPDNLCGPPPAPPRHRGQGVTQDGRPAAPDLALLVLLFRKVASGLFKRNRKEKCSLNAREMFSPQHRTADLCLKRQRVLGLWVRRGRASTGWGPRGPALGPGADTAHTRAHAGAPQEFWGVRVTGGKRGHGPLGAPQLPQGHRRDQAPEGLRTPVGGARSGAWV